MNHSAMNQTHLIKDHGDGHLCKYYTDEENAIFVLILNMIYQNMDF